MTADEIAARLAQIGGKRWTKDAMDRVYFSDLGERLGLRLERYKSGNVAAAWIGDEPVSNSEARRILAALEHVKIYYDLTTGELMLTGRRDNRGYVQQCIDAVAADVLKAFEEDPMERVTISKVDVTTGQRKVRGWFDADAAELFEEKREVFDGSNLAGVHLRDQHRGQVLYHTSGDRWVLHQWSRWEKEDDTYAYIGVAEARDWLILNSEDDETLERLFGAPPEPERGPGRPQIGERVEVRLPQDLIDALDAEAARQSTTRPEIIRTMLWQQLYTARTGKAYTERVDAGVGTDEEEGI